MMQHEVVLTVERTIALFHWAHWTASRRSALSCLLEITIESMFSHCSLGLNDTLRFYTEHRSSMLPFWGSISDSLHIRYLQQGS